MGLTSCYNRIGDLTLVSNRNFDTSANYELVERNVTAKVKSKKRDALERAIDKATESKEGEHMRNVKIYVSWSGKKIKVEGDVYGIKQE